MSHALLDQYVRSRRRGQEPTPAAGRADHELLESFAVHGEEAAFAALVQRHGPMVRGLCRRLLGDPGQADDVFQATFLVLARQAGSIRRRTALSSWLYGVAWRLAHKAQRGNARRRHHERRAAADRPRPDTPDTGWTELLALLDEELARLPEQARAPLLLCYLEGCTQDEAAQILGWSVGSLRRRLQWGRDLLRQRLTRRGATLSAGLFALVLAPQAATASVADSLVVATARAAVAFAARNELGTAAAALAQGALSALWRPPLKVMVSLLLTVGLLTAGAGWASHTADDESVEPPPAASATGPTLQDHRGDPLPEGALVRFGSRRFRHASGINGADLAPDGKLIATEGGDGVLRLMDTTTGQALHTFPDLKLPNGHNDGMRVLAFSPDSKRLLVPGASGVRLLDAATGKELRSIGASRGSTRCCAFSADGKQIAFTDSEGTTFFEAATGKEQHGIPLAGKWLAWWLAYAPDGRSVALPGTTPQMVRLCDTATGKEIGSFSNGADVVTVAFAPNGKTVAVAGKDHAVRLWDVATTRQVRVLAEEVAQPGRDHLSALAFSPDGKALAAGTSDNSIQLWDPATGKALRRLQGHTWTVTGLFFHRDGKTLFSTSFDGTVRRWDVAAGREIRGQENDLDQSHMARSADGKLLATAGADGTISLWEAATGRKLRTLEGHRRGVFTLAFSPDGRRLASGGWERTVRVWDVATGKGERALTCAPGPNDQGRIEAVAFAPDGRLLAACDTACDVVHLWDAATGLELRQLAQGRPVAVAFAPDGKALATGGWDGNLELWDVANGNKLRTIRPADGMVQAIAYSPDGRTVATGHHGPHVSLWDSATGSLIRQIDAGQEVVWCLAFTPDGRWLATGGLDRTVHLWEVATGRRMHQLRGHAFWVLCLAYGPDGKTLATGGYDGTSLLWTMKPKLEPLPPAGVASLWKALEEGDSGRAYRAVWSLAEHPQQSITFLKDHLRPAHSIDKERVRQWLADLDSDDFSQRDTASRELGKLGAAIEPTLRAALAKATSPEVRRRLETILEAMPRELSPEALRRGRAVRVLELIGDRDAVALLQSLARQTEDDALRDEATAALDRCKRLAR